MSLTFASTQDTTIKHAPNWNGMDVTLCGLSDDAGDDGAVTGEIAKVHGTAPSCVMVWVWPAAVIVPTR